LDEKFWVTHNERVEENLVLELFHAENLLEHVKQLLLGENALAVEGLHARWPLVLVVTC
jgi:hypothetical protein